MWGAQSLQMGAVLPGQSQKRYNLDTNFPNCAVICLKYGRFMSIECRAEQNGLHPQ